MGDQSVSFSESNAMETRKRKMLSISEKIELIKLMENTPKNKKAVAAKFGIPINTVGTIYANRERILEKCKGNYTNMNLKRLRPSTYPDIEESLLDWYIKNHENDHISCLTLRSKALQVAKDLGHDNFSASNGWIERFKVRHNLKFRRNKSKNISSGTGSISNDNSCLNINSDDISQSSSQADITSQHKLYEDEREKHNSNQVWSSIENPVSELTEIKQEYNDSYDCDSHSSLLQNDTRQTVCTVSPSHIVPEVHFTETFPDNQNCLINDSYNNVMCETNYSNFTISDVEQAFNVIANYIENCDGNVGENTHLAVKELKTFISKEKRRKTQSKITDYFSYV